MKPVRMASTLRTGALRAPLPGCLRFLLLCTAGMAACMCAATSSETPAIKSSPGCLPRNGVRAGYTSYVCPSCKLTLNELPVQLMH